MLNLLKAWGPAVLWAAIIFYLSGIPQLEVTSEPLGNFITRKAAHLFEYALLYLLIFRALGYRKISLALSLTILYGITDEIHQGFVPTRTPKLEDVAFDIGGALLGVGLWKYLLSQRLKLKI